MATQALTKEIFEQTIEDNDIVLIDFWASWCGPCRAFAPVYEKVSEGHPGIVFGKVDTEAEPELAASFRIQSIPTLMAVRDSIVLYSQPGALPEDALEDIVRPGGRPRHGGRAPRDRRVRGRSRPRARRRLPALTPGPARSGADGGAGACHHRRRCPPSSSPAASWWPRRSSATPTSTARWCSCSTTASRVRSAW